MGPHTKIKESFPFGGIKSIKIWSFKSPVSIYESKFLFRIKILTWTFSNSLKKANSSLKAASSYNYWIFNKNFDK